MVAMLRVHYGAVVDVGDRVHLRHNGVGGTVAKIDRTHALVEFDDGEDMWLTRDTCRHALEAGEPPRPMPALEYVDWNRSW